MEQHALLSASSAKRWIACPPSARIAAEFPDRESEAAEVGTKAHAQAEKWFMDGIEPMDPYVIAYVAYVTRERWALTDSTLLIEERIDYSHIAPKGFGTADCIIYNRDILHIIDLKYGDSLRVEAENNPQMILYALGAIRQFKIIPKEIKMTICQPGMDNLSTWTITAAELQKLGQQIKPSAKMAWEGKGELSAGDHCTFCPAKNICTEFKSYFTDQYLVTYLGG